MRNVMIFLTRRLLLSTDRRTLYGILVLEDGYTTYGTNGRSLQFDHSLCVYDYIPVHLNISISLSLNTKFKFRCRCCTVY